MADVFDYRVFDSSIFDSTPLTTLEERLSLKTHLAGGSVYRYTFETQYAPGWYLKTNIRASVPVDALNDFKTELRGGRTFTYGFETRVHQDWQLRTELKTGTLFKYDFWTELPQDWFLRTDIRAKAPFRLNFTTVFEPSQGRLGEEYLELYPVGKTDREILTIPIHWYQKGQVRNFSLDVWYARGQEAERIDDIRLSAYAFGADDRLGQEVVWNGYLKAKLLNSLNYVPLDSLNSLSLGPMWPNSKKTVDFQFSMQEDAQTPVGITMIGLKVELLRAVVYGSIMFGSTIFGEYRSKGKKIVLKLHVTK